MCSILKEFKVINNHINDNKFDNPITITTTFETKSHYVHYCYPGFLDGHKVTFSSIDTHWTLFLKSSFFFHSYCLAHSGDPLLTQYMLLKYHWIANMAK